MYECIIMLVDSRKSFSVSGKWMYKNLNGISKVHDSWTLTENMIVSCTAPHTGHKSLFVLFILKRKKFGY